MIKHIFSLFLVTFLTFAVLPQTISAATYYVATNGNDSNQGSHSQPFKTITKGADVLAPGDTLYVRGGTYHEWVWVFSQGTADNPITIAAYPGEKPVIDGTYTIPSVTLGGTDPVTGNSFYWEGLVNFRSQDSGDNKTAQHVLFQGFEVKQSLGRGVVVAEGANYITIDNCTIHHNRSAGFLAQDVVGTVVSNTRIYQSSNFAPYPRGSAELDWPGNAMFTNVTNGVMDNLTVYNNWGEGIFIGKSIDAIVRNSTVYDNFAVNIYTIHSHRVTIQNNRVYGTGTAPFLRDNKAAPCIVIADEPYEDERGSDQTVINNVVRGCSNNFAFWDFPGADNSGLKNALIAHNTFLDSVGNNIQISQGNHSNTRIMNNIISNRNTDSALTSVAQNDQLIFNANLWEKQVDEHVRGANDVVSTNIGVSQSGNTGPGQLLASYFNLTTGSPATDAGVSLGIATDYYGNLRVNSPDIGAHEINAAPTPTDGSSYVYRFWSDEKQGHFYTASAQERDHVITSYNDNVWRYEGIAYRAHTTQQLGTIPVYRFWSDEKQGHFYTASAQEKDHVINTYDDFVWRYEGIAYYVYPLSYTSNVKTVYRFWSDQKQKHFYTASAQERDYVINTYDDFVWRYEGTAWNVPQ